MSWLGGLLDECSSCPAGPHSCTSGHGVVRQVHGVHGWHLNRHGVGTSWGEQSTRQVLSLSASRGLTDFPQAQGLVSAMAGSAIAVQGVLVGIGSLMVRLVVWLTGRMRM